LGSSSYVILTNPRTLSLSIAVDLLRGVDSLASDAAKKRAEAN
jgi:hypothetical protein